MSDKNEQLRTTTKKERMLEALHETLGIVSKAAEKAEIQRRTHYYWLEEDPDYKEAVENISEEVKDFAENALHERIREGSINATTFYLERKAKDRGYGKEDTLHLKGSIDFNREPKALETVLKIWKLVDSKQEE